MFRKKQKTPPDTGRHRVVQSVDRSAVFSYHANRSTRAGNVGRDGDEVEQTTVRVKQKHWWHRLSNLTVLALAALLGVFSLRLDAQPHVVVLGDATSHIFLRQPQAYTAAAHDILAGSWANGNKITVNTGGISQQMRDRFPELEAVSVSLPFIGHKPEVYIQPALPRLVLSSGSSAYVLDRTGRALLDVKQISDAHALQTIPVVTDQSGLTVTPGHVALDSDSVSFITEVNAQLKAQHTTVGSMALPAGGSELDVKVQGTPYMVKFNLRGSAREEAGTYLAVKQQLDGQHKQPSQYIDVRVGGRAYYK